MSLPQLSLAAARNLHLAAQGLLKKPRRRAQPADILSTVQRMSLLQIDTINIVARSPYLVLFSRLGNYPPQWLDNALSQGELMEYWRMKPVFSRAAILHWCVTECSPRTKWAGNTARSGWRNTRMK